MKSVPAGRRCHTVVDSPCDPLTLVASDGLLYMEQQRHRPAQETFGEPDAEPFTEAIRQLEEYFTGGRTRFDLPVMLFGTDFQRRVWAALREIPYGETVSYGQLADRLGQPTASRAVGLANGKNPIGIIVPCHRVVGADGALTGYGGGIGRKRFLLDFERGVSGTGDGSLFPVGGARAWAAS
jgi:methylated-DNA-[protein]-cysteine S-methyltransferase